ADAVHPHLEQLVAREVHAVAFVLAAGEGAVEAGAAFAGPEADDGGAAPRAADLPRRRRRDDADDPVAAVDPHRAQRAVAEDDDVVRLQRARPGGGFGDAI